jgi:prepilin-type N-terminal cleavage/methylation domain-containing protein
MRSNIKAQPGFTLLEVLLVIAIIAILAAIVIIAINPTRQLAESRNTQRRSDVNTVLNAVYQYAIDNNGALPANINSTQREICIDGVAEATCTTAALVYLGELTDSERYLVSLPVDPSGASGNGAGYEIVQSANGRVTVTAPDAELGATITVTR